MLTWKTLLCAGFANWLEIFKNFLKKVLEIKNRLGYINRVVSEPRRSKTAAAVRDEGNTEKPRIILEAPKTHPVKTTSCLEWFSTKLKLN